MLLRTCAERTGAGGGGPARGGSVTAPRFREDHQSSVVKLLRDYSCLK